tara:strand:- start:47402 stop:48394 length:993 start_codon:yes stop_codon:yes gene_type:complete
LLLQTFLRCSIGYGTQRKTTPSTSDNAWLGWINGNKSSVLTDDAVDACPNKIVMILRAVFVLVVLLIDHQPLQTVGSNAHQTLLASFIYLRFKIRRQFNFVPCLIKRQLIKKSGDHGIDRAGGLGLTHRILSPGPPKEFTDIGMQPCAGLSRNPYIVTRLIALHTIFPNLLTCSLLMSQQLQQSTARRVQYMLRNSAFIGLFVLSGILTCLTGCQSDPTTSDQDLTQLEYPRFLEMKANPKMRLVVIDVRSAERYATGHIPGAINISIPDLRPNDPKLADATDIVVYATGWTEYLSPAAAKKLLSMNYKNVYDFRGGIEMWQAYGGRVEP